MKRIQIPMGIMAILLVTSITGFAQDEHPKLEVYGTYSLFRADIDIFDDESLQGFGAGVQWNPYKFVGAVAEFSASFGSSRVPATRVVPLLPVTTGKIDTHVYTYLFGPRAYWRIKPVTVFAHSLFGFATLHADCRSCNSVTNSKFAVALGGGVDVNLTRGLAIRAAQFDYLPIKTSLPLNNGGSSYFRNTRYQAGVVFKF